MGSKSFLTLPDVCHPVCSEPCSDLFTLFIRNQQPSDTLVSFHLPRPLCRSSESQAAFRSFSEGRFWGSELLEHPMPFAHAVPGPGVPCLTPSPSLSPNAAASEEPSCSTPSPLLCCLYACALGHGHDHIPPGPGSCICLPRQNPLGRGFVGCTIPARRRGASRACRVNALQVRWLCVRQTHICSEGAHGLTGERERKEGKKTREPVELQQGT